jgi:hypothetical protein
MRIYLNKMLCDLCIFYSAIFFLSSHFFSYQISWIRRKDYHLLTVDSTTYSGDARFNTIHIPDSKVSIYGDV